MEKVFVVTGYAGTYVDCPIDWVAKVFWDESAASDFVEKCNRLCFKIYSAGVQDEKQHFDQLRTMDSYIMLTALEVGSISYSYVEREVN